MASINNVVNVSNNNDANDGEWIKKPYFTNEQIFIHHKIQNPVVKQEYWCKTKSRKNKHIKDDHTPPDDGYSSWVEDMHFNKIRSSAPKSEITPNSSRKGTYTKYMWSNIRIQHKYRCNSTGCPAEKITTKPEKSGLFKTVYITLHDHYNHTEDENEYDILNEDNDEFPPEIDLTVQSCNVREKKKKPIKTFNVTIKTSLINNAGQGVFNNGETIPKGTYFGPYPGTHYSCEDYDEKFENDRESCSKNVYVFQNETRTKIFGYVEPGDEYDPSEGNYWLIKINHKSKGSNNMVFSNKINGPHRKAFFHVLQDIKKGEELYIDYGETYDQEIRELSNN